MRPFHVKHVACAALAAAAVSTLSARTVLAVGAANFNEAGSVVNGFQDDFTGAALNPDYLEFDGGNDDPPAYSLDGAGNLNVNGGLLGDPNKLLYNPAGGYNNSVQEVLMRITVTAFGTVDGDRGGPATVSNTADGQGINFQFRDLGAGRSTVFLNDARNREDAVPFAWQNNTPYWMRIRHDPGADGAAGDEAFAKIWLADGVTPEPAAFQDTYNYAANDPDLRTGLAGISATSLGTAAAFTVDYLLIKADGLPVITVVPEPAALGLLALGGLGLLARRRRV